LAVMVPIEELAVRRARTLADLECTVCVCVRVGVIVNVWETGRVRRG
jgi:hypothetical protein